MINNHLKQQKIGVQQGKYQAVKEKGENYVR